MRVPVPWFYPREGYMATIRKRSGARGVRYQVQVRIGGEVRNGTFRRKDDADRWAKETEVAIEHGEFVPGATDRKRTVRELILAYTNRKPQLDRDGNPRLDAEGRPLLGGNAKFRDLAALEQGKRIAQLEWWDEHIGGT